MTDVNDLISQPPPSSYSLRRQTGTFAKGIAPTVSSDENKNGWGHMKIKNHIHMRYEQNVLSPIYLD